MQVHRLDGAAAVRPVHAAQPAIAAERTARSASWTPRTASPAAAGAAAIGDIDAYYAAAQGRTGADLLRTLGEITRTGHHAISYGEARTALFTDVEDTDGDNMIPDLFTGELRGPIDGSRRGSPHGFNIEHTWPQSKGATGVAKSDLHHLHASDVTTNSKRGHEAYGDVEQVIWSTGSGANQASLGVDALGTTVFEPAEASKGDIARGLLYFYTRYVADQPGSFTTHNFAHELPTLLKWHEADPVDAAERLRNDLVQRYQGNRNPYIDHPEYVQAADFAHLQVPAN